MRLYLSSFRLGPQHDHLRRLAGTGRRTALIPNALDGAPRRYREEGLGRDVAELGAAGLDATIVDLTMPGAVNGLGAFDILWVRGGNVFVLRRVLADTGADAAVVELLQCDAVVYGGYSAGPCVLGTDLAPLARVDDISLVDDPITDGLGLLDRPFVPHVRSPEHRASAVCDSIASDYEARGQMCWAVSDGEVLLVDGDQTLLLEADKSTG